MDSLHFQPLLLTEYATLGLFGYDYKLLFRRENARSEKIPPNALRYGRLSTSRLQLAGRVCTENQESEIAATISILCIAARPSRGFLVSEDKQALRVRVLENPLRVDSPARIQRPGPPGAYPTLPGANLSAALYNIARAGFAAFSPAPPPSPHPHPPSLSSPGSRRQATQRG